MKRIKKVTVEQTVNVIVDTRNAALDRVVPLSIARAKFSAGELSQCLTNHQYCTHENGQCPLWLSYYRMRG